MHYLRPIPLGSIPQIRPVFVVGAGRSGTTPLQLALNMHPQLGVYGETQAFFVHRKFGADAEIRLRRLLGYWRGIVSGCCPHKDLLDGEDIQRSLGVAPTYAHVLNLIMGAIAAREGKSRWGEKTPAHIFRLAEVRTCFPNAQIIHIVRDPRAVVCSAIKGFRDGKFTDWNVYSTTRGWLRCFKVHTEQEEKQTDDYMLVRYEDFVTTSEHTLRRLCSFLGLEFAKEMLDAHQVAAKYVQKDSSGKMPALHALTQKPLDPTRTDAWKHILSPAQCKLVEQIAGEQMAALGYQPAFRRQYDPPQMRVAYFSTRWLASESRRIADNQSRPPYWAFQRLIEWLATGRKGPGSALPEIPRLPAQPLKRKVIGLNASSTKDPASGSTT